MIAHCLLNQNAISDGTAVCPASFREAVRALLDAEVGVVQLPCPELCCLGLDRGDARGAERPVTVENTRIRRALREPSAGKRLAALAEQAVWQAAEYQRHGFVVLGVVGVDRSPSCGVGTTSDRDLEVPGKGLFMEAISRRLAELGLEIPMLGVRSPEDAAAKIRALLNAGRNPAEFRRTPPYAHAEKEESDSPDGAL